MNDEKPIYWIGTSYKDLLEFPVEARRDVGYQLHRLQNGLDPEDWKPMKTIKAGVRKIRISEDGKIFRVIYVAKFANKVYVLHAFQKKTQKTSSKDIDIAQARYTAIFNEEIS
ncbi:MAG: type II toxin-antitoxin system RelE/ParE family toxin [Pseudomonadota bacterium]|nr:type II toxin-antitoxin system RelE/ParE family toxin [Pseudomonadota bacterium]